MQEWPKNASFHTQFARACADSLLRDPAALTSILQAEDMLFPMDAMFSPDDVNRMLQTLATGAAPNANLPFDYARAHIRSHVYYAELPDQQRTNCMLREYFMRQPGHPRHVEDEINWVMDEDYPCPPASVV